MRNVVASLLHDIFDQLKRPELLSPLISALLDVLSPYIFAILGLWAVMTLGIAAILVLLIRGRGVQ